MAAAMELKVVQVDRSTEAIEDFHEDSLLKFLNFSQEQDGQEHTEVEEDYNKFIKEVTAFVGQVKPKLPSGPLYERLILGLEDGCSLPSMVDIQTLLQQLRELFPLVRVRHCEDASGKSYPQLIVYSQGCPQVNQQNRRGPFFSNANYNRGFDSQMVSRLLNLVASFAKDLIASMDSLAKHALNHSAASGFESDTSVKRSQVVCHGFPSSLQKFGGLLLLEHLVGLLEDDLSCRLAVHHENPNDELLQESAINLVINSEKTRGQLCENLFEIIGGTCRWEDETFSSRDGNDEVRVNGSRKRTRPNETTARKKGSTDGTENGCSTVEASRRSRGQKRGDPAEHAAASGMSVLEEATQQDSKFEAAIGSSVQEVPAGYSLTNLCISAQRLLSLIMELYSSVENRKTFQGFSRNKREDLTKLICDNFNRTLNNVSKKLHFLRTMIQPRQQLAFILEYVSYSGKQRVKDQKDSRWTAEEMLQLVVRKVQRLVRDLKDVDVTGLLLCQLIESCTCLLQEDKISSDAEALLGTMDHFSFPRLSADAVQSFQSFIDSKREKEEEEEEEERQLSPSIRARLIASKHTALLFSNRVRLDT